MRRLALAFCFIGYAASSALAQQAQTPPVPLPAQTPPPATRPGPTPPAVVSPAPGPQTVPPAIAPAPGQQTPRPGGQLPAPGGPPAGQNVHINVTISDSLSADVQTKKSVTLLTVDGRSGQVRSSGGEGVINIDARPLIQRDGRIYLQLTLEYRPELSVQQAQQTGNSRLTMFSESLHLIVADGKPVIASQSADPRSDRKVSLEVTATTVK